MNSRNQPRAPRLSRIEAEWGLVRVGLVLRSIVLVQISVAFPEGLRVADRPTAYAACTVVMFAVSVMLLIRLVLARDVGRAGAIRVIDQLTGLCLLPALAWSLPTTEIVGTWTNWSPAFAISTVTVASAWLSWRWSLVYSGIVALAYFVVALQDPGSDNVSFVANSLTYPAFAVAITGFAFYLRSFAGSSMFRVMVV